MFRWLFRGKQKPERKIRSAHLPEYIEKLTKDAAGNLERKIAHARAATAESKDHIHADLSILEYASLHNDQIPERAKAIMQGNRERYCQRVRQAMERIKLPHESVSLHGALDEGIKELAHLGEDIQRNVMVLREFFEHETSAVNRELAILEHQLLEIKRLLDDSDKGPIGQIRTEWGIYQQHLKECDAIKREMHLLESDDQELARREQKTEERIVAIRASGDYHAGIELQKQSGELLEKEQADMREFDAAISTLQLALKKYAYGGEQEELARAYLENPRMALRQDEALALTSVLDRMAQEIESGALPLKDKKREKSIEAVHALKAQLGMHQQALRGHDESRQGLQKRLSQNVAFLNLAEQERYVQAIKQERQAIKGRLKEFEQDLNVRDPSVALRSLEQLMSSISEMKVTIVD